LSAGENHRVDFVLISPVRTSRSEIEFVLRDRAGNELAVAGASIE